MPDKRLGRGLEALITTHTQGGDYHLDGSIPMNKVKPNRNQPRKEFNPNEMSELIESINNNGILQPVTVRELDNGEFELIAGERRYRAAEALGLTSIPAYIISINSDVEMMEYALIENIQRVDLDPIEEAEGYAILESKYGLTHKNIASKLGKKRSTITNALRLLKLPRDIKNSLISKEISSGHARAILSLKNLVQMEIIFKKILENNYSVRQTEELVKKYINNSLVKGRKKLLHNKNLDLQDTLITILDTKVIVKQYKDGGGSINIKYENNEDLHRIVNILNSSKK